MINSLTWCSRHYWRSVLHE